MNERSVGAAHDWRQQATKLLETRCGFARGSERVERVVLPWIEARATDLRIGPAAYLQRIRSTPSTTPEWRALLHILTVNETSFMRHPEQLARWVESAKARYQQVKRPLNIWSAGCSSGEEVYTLAILLTEAGIPSAITGSDIDPEVIEMARGANRYTWYKVRNMSEQQRQRFVRELPNGRWQVKTSALSEHRLRFRLQNMVDDPPLSCDGGWDFVFCRNVFIYFPTETVMKVAQGMRSKLAEGGELWVGATDALHGLNEDGGSRDLASRLGRNAKPKPATMTRAAKPVEVAVRQIERVQSDYGTVIHLLDRGAADLALEHLRRYLREHPDDAVARTTMGNFQVRAHQFSAAIQSYQQAAQDGHVAAEVSYFQGVVHYKIGDLTRAMEHLQAAQRRDRNCWPAFLLGGMILRKQGRPLPAEMAFERAKAAMRADGDCFSSRAELVNSVHNDPELAAQQIEQYLGGGATMTTVAASSSSLGAK